MSSSRITSLFYINEEQQALAREIFEKINISEIIDALYKKITTNEITAKFFAGQDLERLKDGQTIHWAHLLRDGASKEFIEETVTIGSIHEKIGVTPDIYLSAYAYIFEKLIIQTTQIYGPLNAEKRKAAIGALTRLIMMDIAASLTAYIEKTGNTTKSTASVEFAEKIIESSVTVSKGINKSFIDSLKTSRIANEVDHQVSSISAAIEEMSATFETIDQSARQAQSCTDNVAQSAQHGSQVSTEASQTMENIKDAVSMTAVKTENLAESSQKIEDIVRKIQDIADQTNLLALNATIEAARAGDAGKGFAVVASEVKALSNETAIATKEITEIIGDLVSSIQEISSSMTEVIDAVNSGQEISVLVRERMGEIEIHAGQTKQAMDEISHALTEQNIAIQEISRSSGSILENSKANRTLSANNAKASRISGKAAVDMINELTSQSVITDKMLLKVAESDHLVWVRKVADMIFTQSNETKLPIEELKDHTQCRLGKWYYSKGQEILGTNDIFKKLEEPHALIHKLGREAYNLYEQNRYDEAMDKLAEMEKISETIISMLDQIEKIAREQTTPQAAA
ncbi:MAG: CZB domain-containing protein [Alphaproteobacteria bacterium]|nr:CZB domain-containing protein [Alphaproteobacteria bacterium]